MEAVNTEPTLAVESTDGIALREAVRMEMHRTGMSQARLAKESGIHQTRLNLWLGGKYTGNGQGVAQELARWLKAATERREQAASGSLIETPDWLPTPTANTIMNTLRYAQNAKDIALIYGGAGVGKTFTARRYQDDHPCVWIATMTPAMNSISACLTRIALAVGTPELPRGAARAENAIIAAVESRNGLLIVDEAQFLPPAGLDAVRSLHDASGMGLCFMGNETVYAQITGGSRKAHFAQIFSRVGIKTRLTNPTMGDVETIVQAWNITDTKGKGLCIEIARQAGALRGLTKVLRLASMMLAEDEQHLESLHIQTAWAQLGGAA